MIHALTPYPAMKDSGVPWLGQVPEHWVLRRTKTILRERSEKGFPGEPLLAATQTKGVVRKEDYESRTVLAMKDLHLLKLVKKNDFVISLRSFQGGLESAHYQGIISPAYTILYPVESNFHAYLALLFKSGPYIENLSLFVTGIRQGQNIDYEKLSRSSIPLPPPDEQNAIVRYLDHADRRIRRTIAAKQRLIKLLQEQKQVIIHQAVTRGLDPDVKLKPSGVEWVGDVPEGWEVLPLKRCSHVIKTGSTPKDVDERHFTDDPDGLQWFTPGDFKDNIYLESASKNLSASGVESVKVFPPLSMMMIGIGATIGKVAISQHYASCNQQINSIQLTKSMDIEYSVLLLREYRDFLRKCGKYTTMPIINQDETRNIGFLRPDLEDQKQIVTFITEATQKLDQAISRAQREISLLREYRTRLIADAVTGKLDVRDAAALLPELSDEALPDEAEVDAEELDAEEGAEVEVEA